MKLTEVLAGGFATMRHLVNATHEEHDGPATKEALNAIARAERSIEILDKRRAYMREAYTYIPGTILVLRDGSLEYPIRRKILSSSETHIEVDWLQLAHPTLTFDRKSGLAPTRSSMKPHKLYPKELEAFNADNPPKKEA